ncbi:MAG: hypothetical protein HYW50_04730 [Candidatus Diapherotrites archaeon]|nr:hypothetical protein [Candidatus Diapherotrites archaeon]
MGTCLPELSIALSASRQKHAELGLGDILGNVFADCTLTLGIISLISPIRPQTNSLALLSGSLMVFSLIFVVLLFNRKKHVSKKFGAVLVLMYAIFLALQFLFEEIATKA